MFCTNLFSFAFLGGGGVVERFLPRERLQEQREREREREEREREKEREKERERSKFIRVV